MAARALLVLVTCLALAGCAAPASVTVDSSSPASCTTVPGVQPISFSGTKYPRIRAHVEAAIAAGQPEVLVLQRDGADARRSALLRRHPDPLPGFDRDEYPPAVGRAVVRAHVAYVPSSENRSHGAVLGTKLRRLCDGTRFRYVFY